MKQRYLWLLPILVCCLMLIGCAKQPASAQGTPIVEVTVPTIVQLSPTPVPPTPTIARPTPTHAPVIHTPVSVRPTQAVHTGINGNPWGYDFNTPGNVIKNPPATFCAYFACVSSFWTATNGYVVKCVDGKYSHSGGRTGVCNKNGGVSQTLYSH